MRNEEIYREALSMIRQLYGPDAEFRPGQYEAIEATMLNRRTLVVQRTGWGKSLVYFACTKLLRNRGRGVTLVVSPLLALMANQMEAAEKLGLQCDALNSATKDRREEILQKIADNGLDLVLVTPETLFAQDVQSRLQDMKIGLFVIDEAHCISDWGHDFRLDYCHLKDVIARLPFNVPVLATTATANNRVVADLKAQLRDQVYISRGPLGRDSLSIQVLPLPHPADRYAWLLENLPKLPGSGIIYCLTQRDCDYLADFLNRNGISALAYYSRNQAEEEQNIRAEQAFQRNEIKALVATIKLGMGYDKGDIAFVIHYQMPGNIVSYYQQIGRAGRNIPRAYVFLMCGREDETILEYFIKTAFPSENETRQVLECVGNSGGISVVGLREAINIRNARLEKALMFLQKDGFLFKEKGKYYLSPKPFVYDREHYEAVTAIRHQEMEQMKQLVNTRGCYSEFIVRALDDPEAAPCGHCANCLGRELLPLATTLESREKASAYLEAQRLVIEPRKQWAQTEFTRGSRIAHKNQEGLCLSKYGAPGYGELVRRDKHSTAMRFCEELVGKSANLLRPLLREKKITHITCVPSLRSRLVEDFGERLAESCGLPFVPLLEKTHAEQQKYMKNSSHQCANAQRSFSVKPGAVMPERVLLVDDIVDSRWTLTVCGFLLMEAGCREVYPYALADSSRKEG